MTRNRGEIRPTAPSRLVHWLSDHWVEVVLTLLGLFYVVYRFLNLPLAPDERGVLYHIRHSGFANNITAANAQDYNALQHYLFVLAASACYRLPWLGEIQRIRIPSLAAFGVYLAALWQLRGSFTNRWIGRLAFAALLGSAYVLDYFSVGRGYGMAMAFALLAIAAALQVSDDKPGWGRVAVWSGALAALSNLSLLYYYNAVLLVVLFLSRRQSKAYLFGLASSALVVGASYLPKLIIMARSNGVVFWWGGTHFVGDTVLSLVKSVLYHGSPFYPWPSTPTEIVLAPVVTALALAAIIWLIWQRHRAGSIVAFCTLIVVGQIYAGHYLAHVQFPVERAAMYFIPLFVLQIAYVADGTPLRWLRLGLSGLLVAYTVTAAWSLNLTHMAICKTMADIPALIQDLAHAHEKNGQPVELCMSDGAKWQVWYYAELAAKVPENERLQERECFAQIDWLYLYETHCGLPTEEGRMFTATTTHLFLSGDDYPPAWFPHDTVLVREYPVSHWRLYSKIGEASAHDEDIVRMAPDFADGHSSLGNALKREGKVSEAIGQYEQALRINPNFAEAHYNLGLALADTGRIEEAIAHYQQALRIRPVYAEAHNNLGTALARTGRITEAITRFEQALRIRPDYAEAHNNLALALAETGRIEEAIAHFEQALRIKPDDAEAHYNLALVLAQVGRVPEAIAQCEQTLRIRPDYAEAQNTLARLQARQ